MVLESTVIQAMPNCRFYFLKFQVVLLLHSHINLFCIDKNLCFDQKAYARAMLCG